MIVVISMHMNLMTTTTALFLYCCLLQIEQPVTRRAFNLIIVKNSEKNERMLMKLMIYVVDGKEALINR
jgi:hypothetical protein